MDGFKEFQGTRRNTKERPGTVIVSLLFFHIGASDFLSSLRGWIGYDALVELIYRALRNELKRTHDIQVF